MSTTTSRSSLQGLFDYLDGLTARADMEVLRSHLANLNGCGSDLLRHARFSEDRYTRNLVREGEHYHALVLCWRSGQCSPIHDHAESVCGVRVLSGTASETVFECSPSGLLRASTSRDWRTDDVMVSRDADTHQVANLQGEGQDLVTLHIYSPPLLRMATFSLSSRAVGEYRPVVEEFTHGGGI